MSFILPAIYPLSIILYHLNDLGDCQDNSCDCDWSAFPLWFLPFKVVKMKTEIQRQYLCKPILPHSPFPPLSWSLSLYLNCHPKSLKYQGLNSFLLYTEYKWKRVKCEVNLKQGKVCDLNFWIASLFSAKVLCLSCFPREGPCLTDCNLEYILGGNITKIMASIYETW